MTTVVGASQIQLRVLALGVLVPARGVIPIEPDSLPEIALSSAAEHAEHYDTIVIGVGTGGGVVGKVPADATRRAARRAFPAESKRRNCETTTSEANAPSFVRPRLAPRVPLTIPACKSAVRTRLAGFLQ